LAIATLLVFAPSFASKDGRDQSLHPTSLIRLEHQGALVKGEVEEALTVVVAAGEVTKEIVDRYCLSRKCLY
jgi:hypothetical protein